MGIKRELRELRDRAYRKAGRSGTLISYEDLSALDAAMMEWDREYNSPEAVAERERQYLECCRIGELRRRAIESGQDPDEMAPFPKEPDRDAKYHPGMSIHKQVEAFINGD